MTLGDGRRVFVKAAPPWIDFQASCVVMEAHVLVRLPMSIPHPQLLGHASAHGWQLLALEWVTGTMPGFPWTADQLEAAHRACGALSELVDPATFSTRSWAGHFHAHDAHGPDIAAVRSRNYHRPTEHGEDRWLDAMVAAYGADLADLADASRAVTGTALSHNDVRPDNLLYDDRAMTLLDWNWVCLGPPWLDFLGLLPLAHAQGVDVTPWLRRDLFAEADDDTIDAVLAATAMKALSGQDQPLAPGLPDAVWQLKQERAHDTVQLLADRRGWD